MKRLWAPWRMRYVVGPKKPDGGCVFCAAAAADRDEELFVLCRGAECFTILNTFPYNTGHIMVVPYQHASWPTEVSGSALAEMMQMAAAWTAVLRTVMGAAGINVGLNLGPAAGAGIADHLHLHLVPRWDGDTNFMPVIADTKVMPEDLASTYAKLRAGWDEARTT